MFQYQIEFCFQLEAIRMVAIFLTLEYDYIFRNYYTKYIYINIKILIQKYYFLI